MYTNELPTQLTVDNAIVQLGDTDASQKGRQFKARFIQAGIAGYPKQFGNVLITKETLNKFVFTLIGKPVIINHKENISEDDIVGEVTHVWFNEEDGWFWCEGYLTDETAINLIKDKHWSVSCSYDVLLLDDEGGTENNVKYDQEFLNGVFTHLAIVENPRYERANIVVNSKTEVIKKGTDTKKSDNSKEQDMALIDELKKLIKKVQNNKEQEMSTKDRILAILNEKEVEEDVIEEVENELEEIEKEEKEKEIKNKKKCKNEDDKEDDKEDKKEEAENKKAKNEDEEDKEEDKEKVKEVEKDVEKDVDNKCKNSVNNAIDYFNKVNEVYNSSCKAGVQQKYETQEDRLEAGKKY